MVVAPPLRSSGDVVLLVVAPAAYAGAMSTAVSAPDRWDEFRNKQREDFADRIIEAVSDAAAGGLNVTDIVRRTGTSRKTFYKYFDSLAAAVIYTQRSVIRRISEHATTTVPAADSGRERLLSILRDQSTLATESPALFRFLSYFDYTFRYAGMGRDEQYAFDASMRALATEATDIFRSGQSDGSIRADLDPDLTVGAMSGAMIGLVQRYLAITAATPNPEQLLKLADLEVSAWRSYLL
jgi:AcrR family transcriptional regulator